MSKHLRTGVLITALLLLTSCSRLELGYRNLDWLIPWSMDNYVTLTKEQKTWLKPRLVKHIAWHCQTQLPAYAAWLQRSSSLVTAEQFDAHLNEFRQAMDAIAVKVTPDITELLQGLSDAQVKELGESMAKQNKEQREDYLDVSLDEQITERSERMQERLQPWFGRLQPEQKARVMAWSQQLGNYNQGWIDSNQRWQHALLAAVQARESAEFPAQVKRLLQDRMSVWTPAYRQEFTAAQQALSSLLADLMASADAKQRARFTERLEGTRKQVAEMSCPAASAPTGITPAAPSS